MSDNLKNIDFAGLINDQATDGSHWIEDNIYFLKTQKAGKSVYYAFDADEVLGKGGFGTVYKAYEITSRNGKYLVDPEKPVALKILKPQKNIEELMEEVSNESARCNSFHRVLADLPAPAAYDNQVFVFMPWLPANAKPLLKFTSEINEQDLYDSLSFSQRVQIILSLVMGLQQMHSDKADNFEETLTRDGKNVKIRKMREAMLHLDLKPDNLRIHIEQDDNQKIVDIQTTFCDFGFATRLNDAEKQLSRTVAGSLANIDPQFCKTGMAGARTDFFSIAPIFFALLGATSPTRTRAQLIKKGLIHEGINADFDLDGILEPLPKGLNREDKETIINFLKKIADKDNYHDRPDDEEILWFFTRLYNFSRTKELERKGKITLIKHKDDAEHNSVIKSKNFNFTSYLAEQNAIRFTRLLNENPELINQSQQKDSFDGLSYQYPQARKIINSLTMLNNKTLASLEINDKQYKNLMLIKTLYTNHCCDEDKPGDKYSALMDKMAVVTAAEKNYKLFEDFRHELEADDLTLPNLCDRLKAAKDLQLCARLYALSKQYPYTNSPNLYEIKGLIRTVAFSIWQEQYLSVKGSAEQHDILQKESLEKWKSRTLFNENRSTFFLFIKEKTRTVDDMETEINKPDAPIANFE